MYPKTVATIEARMRSSRLPGKVLLPVLGQPLLHHLVARLKVVPSLDEIVLATTLNADDDVLEELAGNEGIFCFRGSEDDVMGRVIGAAESRDAEIVVEIIGDSPIIDPEIVEHTIRMFRANEAVYVTNCHVQTYPDGMETQVFRLDTLKRSAAMTADPLDREHVTLHIRNHPEIFPTLHLVAPPGMHWPKLGLTLDEPADFQLIKRIIEYFGADNPLFGCVDVVRLLRAHPDWVTVNQSVVRKGDA